jgi:hypothetical protein
MHFNDLLKHEKPNQYLKLVYRFSLSYSILEYIETLYQIPINFGPICFCVLKVFLKKMNFFFYFKLIFF